MANQTLAIKSIIDRKLIGPAYGIMVVSLVVRGVIAIIAPAVDYAHTALWVRLPIDILVALGVIVGGEIIVGAAAGAWAQARRALHDLSSAKMPAAKREALAADLRGERRAQIISCVFASLISSGYGVSYIASGATGTSIQAIIPEIFAFIAVPFCMFYFAALHRTAQRDPTERSTELATEGLEKRLGTSGDRVAAGNYDNRDVRMIQSALPEEQRRIFDALLLHDDTTTVHTFAQVFAEFHITDLSRQRQMRRIVRAAADDQRAGVFKDPASGEWKIPRSSLLDLFPNLLTVGPVTDRHGHEADTKRTDIGHEAAPERRTGGQSPDNVLTFPGQRPGAAVISGTYAAQE